VFDIAGMEPLCKVSMWGQSTQLKKTAATTTTATTTATATTTQ